jgi:tetratricopeptide (TPR) repeat protein
LALHEGAIEGNPNDPTTLIYYGLCLAFLGRYEEANEELRAALEITSQGWMSSRMLLFFAELVISPSPRPAALAELRAAVGEGFSFGTWNFGPLLAVGRELDNPDIEWLEQLAAVLRGREDPQVLDGWDAWQKAA